jgi:phosphopantothenoylcysteine decarboxylase/phosphopantothenate--cysteine ligase
LSNILPQQKIKILLGICGGVAAYKSADLVRRLKEREFDVRVVMTRAASEFITPMTLQAVSGYPVHDALFDREAEAAMGHIELAKWADWIVIAPATANSIAKISAGICDDLLSTVIVASSAKLILAPAMNQQMWANSATQDNVKRLSQRGALFLGPASGEQACGDVGFGRMLEPLDIAEQLVRSRNELNDDSTQDQTLKGKKVLITAGPTVEAIDPVRFISNHSSGKMGFSLARAAQQQGAEVTLISGPVSLSAPNAVAMVDVTSAEQMFEEVRQRVAGFDVFIGCAAVADYTPVEVATQKIKKNDNDMHLVLKKNVDIISWVAAQNNSPFVVGFAAESEKLEQFAESKLKRKKLDMICANDISESTLGFNSDNNRILILHKNGSQKQLETASKESLANDIVYQVSLNL